MQCVQTMEKGYAGISAATKQGMGESFKEKFKDIMSRRKMIKLFSNFKVSFVYFDGELHMSSFRSIDIMYLYSFSYKNASRLS